LRQIIKDATLDRFNQASGAPCIAGYVQGYVWLLFRRSRRGGSAGFHDHLWLVNVDQLMFTGGVEIEGKYTEPSY